MLYHFHKFLQCMHLVLLYLITQQGSCLIHSMVLSWLAWPFTKGFLFDNSTWNALALYLLIYIFLKFLLATIFLVMQNLYFPEVVAPIYTCLFYGHIRLLSLIFLSWRSKQNLMSFSMLRLSIFLYYMDRFNQYISLQVINDLLDPIGQNLRVREDAQV